MEFVFAVCDFALFCPSSSLGGKNFYSNIFDAVVNSKFPVVIVALFIFGYVGYVDFFAGPSLMP